VKVWRLDQEPGGETSSTSNGKTGHLGGTGLAGGRSSGATSGRGGGAGAAGSRGSAGRCLGLDAVSSGRESIASGGTEIMLERVRPGW
jgi:hypothetical protein